MLEWLGWVVGGSVFGVVRVWLGVVLCVGWLGWFSGGWVVGCRVVVVAWLGVHF